MTYGVCLAKPSGAGDWCHGQSELVCGSIWGGGLKGVVCCVHCRSLDGCLVQVVTFIA